MRTAGALSKSAAASATMPNNLAPGAYKPRLLTSRNRPSRNAAAASRQTRLNYTVADLLNPPGEWIGHFDFVLESYTLQVRPPELRPAAMRSHRART